MTGFSVEFTQQAVDELGALTKPIAQRILDKIQWLARLGGDCHFFLADSDTGLDADLTRAILAVA